MRTKLRTPISYFVYLLYMLGVSITIQVKLYQMYFMKTLLLHLILPHFLFHPLTCMYITIVLLWRCYKRPTLQKTNTYKDQLGVATKEQLYTRPTPTKDHHLKNLNARRSWLQSSAPWPVQPRALGPFAYNLT